MLLTSSQLSMGISSAIVFIFSTILFLSGYILQQQTVHNIEAIIRPPPPPEPILSSSTQTENALLETGPSIKIQWDTVGYVQILQRYSEICASAIIFAELARQESRARRILVYPDVWDATATSSDLGATSVQTRNWRFLRKIAARYDISLRAIPTDLEPDTQSPASFPASLRKLDLSLTDLKTVLHLNPAGIITNATILNTLFALDTTTNGILFLAPNPNAAPDLDTDITSPQSEIIASLFHPNPSTYHSTQESTSLSSSVSSPIFASTSHLPPLLSLSDGSDARIDTPGYIRISDPNIPGPDYDIPSHLWDSARPDSQPERGIWEGIYAEYRAQRRAICGLEVEVWTGGGDGGGGGGYLTSGREKESL